MSKLRRYQLLGHPYFITCVTYNRIPILIDTVEMFWASIESVQQFMPFEIIAWVIIPDHFHMIIEPKRETISDVMRRLKSKYSGLYRSAYGLRRGRIWQHRFWDHIIRNVEDMNRHIDYIHFNPVKHGLVLKTIDYPYSSFTEFLDNGLYTSDWGSIELEYLRGNFGE